MTKKKVHLLARSSLSLLLTLALILASITSVNTFVQAAESESIFEQEVQYTYPVQELATQATLLHSDAARSERHARELSFLTKTLTGPIGMQGFEGEYAITAPTTAIFRFRRGD